jgi:hypothetical protein
MEVIPSRVFLKMGLILFSIVELPKILLLKQVIKQHLLKKELLPKAQKSNLILLI